MKLFKPLVSLAACFILAGAAVPVQRASAVYPMNAVIVSVDQTENVLTIENPTGELYQWEGCTGWKVGDSVFCAMDDNGTLTCRDDSILALAKTGF